MPVSLVQLYNMALNRIGVSRTVASVGEATQEAQTCTLWYEACRDLVLEDVDWGFARRRAALVSLGDPPDRWAYRYEYPDPANCIAVRTVDDGRYIQSVEDRIPFVVESTNPGDPEGRVILTDIADAIVTYTGRVVNPGLYSPAFVDALAWRLAQEIGMPLAVSTTLQDRASQRYLLAITQARRADFIEQQEGAPPESEFVQARSGPITKRFPWDYPTT